VPKLRDIGGVWNTIREINVADIREEAEQAVRLALVGEAEPREMVALALQQPLEESNRSRASWAYDALLQSDLPLAREQQSRLRDAALIILAVDGKRPLPVAFDHTLNMLSMLAAPTLVVCLGSGRLPATSDGDIPQVSTTVTFVPVSGDKPDVNSLAREIVQQLPTEQRVAAARRLPGLRDTVARDLIAETSFSNATYAFTSGLPEMIPLLNLPLNAADVLVLTKNQALLVYRLGLAFGASGDFQAQMREILPVVGGGFLWRQVARQMIGLIPGFGLVPKVAVAYAGTFVTGQSALLWYSRGEVLSKGAMGRLYRQAMAIGRQRAKELVSRRKGKAVPPLEGSTPPANPRRRLLSRLFRRGRPPEPPALPPVHSDQ
jgi:uncharacterized protein (DUF697 family)